MSEEAGVVLAARCLLSKWGFNDGDEPDSYLDWLDECGLPYPDNWHSLLRQLVRERLMPHVREDVALVDVETIHNPIRAETVDGREVDWYDSEGHHDRLLIDTAVNVPFAEVYEMQQRHDKATS